MSQAFLLVLTYKLYVALLYRVLLKPIPGASPLSLTYMLFVALLYRVSAGVSQITGNFSRLLEKLTLVCGWIWVLLAYNLRRS